MDDLVSKYLAAQREFGDRVHAIREDQWHAPTPDSEWDVAALVEHVIDEDRWLAPLLHGLDLESAGKVVQGTRSLPVDGGVGANLAEEWDEAVIAASDACTADGAMQRTVSLSRGPTPARDYLAEMIFDHFVHAWDLGKAIGYPRALPEDLAEEMYAMAKGAKDMLESSGLFAAPVTVPDDAPTIDKLVALTGRDPS
jgi:uncharacterized protein (TIGR03086 family)